MGKGSSGHKQNMAAKRKRALYVAEDRCNRNKRRKAAKEKAKDIKLARKGKGIYAKYPELAEKDGVTVTVPKGHGCEGGTK